MTREEAIYIINNLKPTNTKSSFDAYVVGKAITMAIEALSAEPCEGAISRKDLIEFLEKVTVTDGITFETGFKQILTDIRNAPSVIPVACIGKVEFDEEKLREIVSKATQNLVFTNCENTPSVQPIRPKGKWKSLCYQNVECSSCGYVAADSDIDEYKFCPNCGTEMGNGEE